MKNAPDFRERFLRMRASGAGNTTGGDPYYAPFADMSNIFVTYLALFRRVWYTKGVIAPPALLRGTGRPAPPLCGADVPPVRRENNSEGESIHP